ncbi:MAG TPA: hypothetical protein VFH46_21120 [Pyrinomonadaceae bacterium]|nr:hypothetical protein [Pyrinomonadaceae bacterium]
MQAGSDPIRDVKEAVCDGFRQIGDFSYAILPKDIAHKLAEFKKSVLTELTTALQWEMEWIDNRVAGGDKLREQWRERCERQTSTSGPAA